MYTAKSIKDIATLFEQNATNAENQSKATKAVIASRLLHREAIIWGQAAEILMNTKLEK